MAQRHSLAKLRAVCCQKNAVQYYLDGRGGIEAALPCFYVQQLTWINWLAWHQASLLSGLAPGQLAVWPGLLRFA